MTKKEWFKLSISGNITQENIDEWISEGNSIDFLFEKEQTSYSSLSGFTIIISTYDDIYVNNNALMIAINYNFFNNIEILLKNKANLYLLFNNDINKYLKLNKKTKEIINKYHKNLLNKNLKKVISNNNIYYNDFNLKFLKIKKTNLPLNRLI